MRQTKTPKWFRRGSRPRGMTYLEQELKGVDLTSKVRITRLERFREDASLFIHELIEEIKALESKVYSMPPNAKVIYEDDHIQIIIRPKIEKESQ